MSAVPLPPRIVTAQFTVTDEAGKTWTYTYRARERTADRPDPIGLDIDVQLDRRWDDDWGRPPGVPRSYEDTHTLIIGKAATYDLEVADPTASGVDLWAGPGRVDG